MPINNMEVPPSPAPKQPEMQISDSEVNASTEDIPNDLEGGEDNGNELQSNAAKLAQKVSTANPETAKIAIKQFNSVAAKALNSDDINDVVDGIEKAANNNGGENEDSGSEMPLESHKFSANLLDEMIDKILDSSH